MRPPAACNSRKRAGQGFGAKSFRPRSTAVDVGIDRLRRRRMQGRRRRLRRAAAPSRSPDCLATEPRRCGRAIRDAARAARFCRAAAVDAVDRRLVEHQRDALRRRRRAAHARLRQLPVGDELGGLPGSAIVSGPVEFGDQQRRLDRPARRPECAPASSSSGGWLLRNARRGRVARHLDAERKAADGLRAAGDRRGRPWPRAPASRRSSSAPGRRRNSRTSSSRRSAPATSTSSADIAAAACGGGIGCVVDRRDHRGFNTCRMRRFCARSRDRGCAAAPAGPVTRAQSPGPVNAAAQRFRPR